MKKISERDRILLMFIGRCSDEYNEVDPELVLEEAKRLIEKMHSQTKPSMKAWDYINEAFETIKQKEQRDYGRRTPAYQVAAVMYILLTLAKDNDDWRDEYLARNLANKVFALDNFNCTQEEADNVINEIRALTEPEISFADSHNFPLQLEQPKQIEEAIEKINALEIRPGQINWQPLLNQMLVAVRLIPQKYPPILWLQYLTVKIKVYDYRIEVLHKLQDLAPKHFPTTQEVNEFISDCDSLVYITRRLKELTLQDKQIENLWSENPVFNELALILKEITPQEMVALSQALYVRDRSNYMSAIEFSFRLRQFIGELRTKNIYEFCQYLFSAESYRKYIMGGSAFENKLRTKSIDIMDSLPNIHTVPLLLRNACYEEYIVLRIKQIQNTLAEDNDRLYLPSDEEVMGMLLEEEKTVVEEYKARTDCNYVGHKDVLKMSEYFIRYLEDKIKKMTQKPQPAPVINYNIGGDYVNEKQVEHEVHVGKGGIGINNNKQ